MADVIHHILYGYHHDKASPHCFYSCLQFDIISTYLQALRSSNIDFSSPHQIRLRAAHKCPGVLCLHTVVWISHTSKSYRAWKLSVMVKLKLAGLLGNPLWRSLEYWMKGNCPLTGRFTFIPIQWLLYGSKWQATQAKYLNWDGNA